MARQIEMVVAMSVQENPNSKDNLNVKTKHRGPTFSKASRDDALYVIPRRSVNHVTAVICVKVAKCDVHPAAEVIRLRLHLYEAVAHMIFLCCN